MLQLLLHILHDHLKDKFFIEKLQKIFEEYQQSTKGKFIKKKILVDKNVLRH